MIVGVGTDIFSISRLAPIADDLQDPFFKKSFTEKEQKQASERPDPLFYYATCFAGKEAVYKAISGCGCGFVASDIEVLGLEYGRPAATISGSTADMVRGHVGSDVAIHVSLSFEEDYAVAVALAETKPD